jgi:hypothetical protein
MPSHEIGHHSAREGWGDAAGLDGVEQGSVDPGK